MTSRLRLAMAAAMVAAVSVSVAAPGAKAAPGIVTTVAGGLGTGDPTRLAQSPRGLALHGHLLYVVDNTSTLWADVPVVRVLDLRTGTERVAAGMGRQGDPRPGFNGDGGPATSGALNHPRGAVVDSRGRLFFVDWGTSVVRMVDEAGVITTYAGGSLTQYVVGDGRQATDAFLYGPSDVALDSAGNLYIADTYHERVRKVDAATGIISTVAGNGVHGYSGDGGPATEAALDYPGSVALDAAGNLYIAVNNRVRRVDAVTGTIETIAGGGTQVPAQGVPATQVEIQGGALDVDSNGTLFFIDRTRLWTLDASGSLRLVAGTGKPNYRDIGPIVPIGEGGPAIAASFDMLNAVVSDGSGNIYLADQLHVWRIRPDGTITTIAGNGHVWWGGDGGPATGAQLLHPRGTAFDPAGNMYIADAANHRVRKVDTFGVITTVAGTGAQGSDGDGGPATKAQLNFPAAMAFDGAGNLYVAESGGGRIRRIDTAGNISTFAGAGGGVPPVGDGGPAIQASFQNPTGLTFDGDGNLYVAAGARIRKIDTSGIVTTVVGGGTPADEIGDGLRATDAHLSEPSAVQFDTAGRMVIFDRFRNRIRRVDTNGIITTIAGTAERGHWGDGGPGVDAGLNLAGFSGGLATDSSGNVFIADARNSVIRKLDQDGIITTIAGTGRYWYGGDGLPALEATFYVPNDLTLDRSGNLYVADAENRRIRRIAGAGSGPAPLPPTPSWTISSTTTSTSTTTTSTTSSSSTTTTTTKPTTTTSTTTTTTTVPVARPVPEAPYSVWAQPTATPLDGLASWIATANDPAATTGQLPPTYVYGHLFGFANAPALGIVGLVTTPGGKFAAFSVVEPNGTSHDIAIPFDWKAGRFYLPLVHQVAPGNWGAWIYDHTAGTWTLIGGLALPASWGKLGGQSVTSVLWMGPTGTRCSTYPRAEVLNHPPIGIVGSTQTTATLTRTGTNPGNCPAEISLEHGVWSRYGVGFWTSGT